MANSRTKRSRPVRTLVVFTILTILLPFVALAAGVYFDGKSDDNPDGASFAPGLALDLQGGTQIILEPVTTDGSEITDETVSQAIKVIRQRIDSSGVSEAEITSQGQSNIVVGIPGEVDQETIDLVAKPAQMRFRPVLTYNVGTPAPQPSTQPSDGQGSGGGSGEDAEGSKDGGSKDAASGDDVDTSPNGSGVGGPVTAATDDATPEPTATATAAGEGQDATPSPEPSPSAGSGQGEGAEPTDPSDLAQITPEVQAQFQALDCSDPKNLVGGGGDDPDEVLVTCSEDGTLKYVLGPMEVDGTHIASASSGLVAGPNGTVTNEWGVTIDFDSEGTAEFRETTTRLQGLEPPRNQFAIVLDGLVVSAPSLDPGVIISNGQAQISGNFTQETAATLANQLSFGALPIAFEVQSQEEISATLGSEQLRNGLIAGLVGMALVVVYSLFQYRSLGLLTVGSLVVAGVMTYLAIALLSWTMGYRLSLAGVAGLIVAIGFTADSFIVYFERIRDEIRDGRTLSYAVERGWNRARRTVLAAKSVTFISALILYFLAVGGVQGFAFTLGLTTIIDVMVVFWFTHPMMEILTKIPFFSGGHRWSGLSPERLRAGSGPRYAGAGRVRPPEPAPAAAAAPADAPADEPVREPVTASVAAPRSAAPSTDEGGRRLTIAERRAAERKAAAAAEAESAGAPDADQPATTRSVAVDDNEESR